MNEYPDGIVTYPGSARSTLGLQWNVGASYDEITDAVGRFVPPDSTVVCGIVEGNAPWATLVLGFDADKRATVITTVDPSALTAGGGRGAHCRRRPGCHRHRGGGVGKPDLPALFICLAEWDVRQSGA